MKKYLFLSAAIVSAIGPVPSFAQSGEDVLVMRRGIAPPKNPATNLQPIEGANLNGYYWVVSGWLAGEDQCTPSSDQKRYRGCVYQGKQAEPENCPQPAPDTERTVPDYRGCGYNWTITSAGPWKDQCTETSRNITSECRRQDGELAPDIYCSSEPKPREEKGFNAEGCGYKWAIGEYGDWDSTCSDKAKRLRLVECKRSDDTVVSASSCPGDVPQSIEISENYTGCSYSWVPSVWTSQTPSCGEVVAETRTAACLRTDGTPAENDSLCTDDLPVLERDAENFEGCTYEWSPGEWSDWSSQCSTKSTRRRQATCIREDGTVAELTSCDQRSKPHLVEEKEILSGCSKPGISGEWATGPWSDTEGCSASITRVREVSCRRDDGSLTDNSECDSQTKPKDRETVSDYSACSYSWAVASQSEWNSTCSHAASASRTIVCRRQDGEDADSKKCDASAKPSSSIISAVYTGCPTQWAYGEWSDWNSQCSASASRTRIASCYLQPPAPAELEPASKERCSLADREPIEEDMAIYSGCPSSWHYGEWGWNGQAGAKSSTCSSKPQQTRSATCKKIGVSGEYETVDASQCADADKEDTQDLNSDYSGCTYRWINNTEADWSSWSGTCSPTAVRTRPVKCERSDGAHVDFDNCPDPVPETQQTGNVTDCTGLAANNGFEEALISGGTVKNWIDQTEGYGERVTDAKVDSYAYHFNGNLPSYRRIMQDTQVQFGPDSTFTVTFWCKGGSIKLSLGGRSDWDRNYKTFNCGPQWVQHTASYKPHFSFYPNQNKALIGIYGNNATIDDVIVTN